MSTFISIYNNHFLVFHLYHLDDVAVCASTIPTPAHGHSNAPLNMSGVGYGESGYLITPHSSILLVAMFFYLCILSNILLAIPPPFCQHQAYIPVNRVHNILCWWVEDTTVIVSI